MWDEIAEFIIFIILVVAAVVGTATYFAGASAGRTDGYNEACSYRCNLSTGRWPAKADYEGRDDKGRLKCKCWQAEETK